MKKRGGQKRESLRGAVNKMCRQCIYDKQAAGTWRQQVAACTAKDCALYSVRPGSKGGSNGGTETKAA